MKNLCSIFLAIGLLFTVNNVAFADFKDVPKNHSNYEDIQYLLEKGVIDDGNVFGVKEIVTRAEVAVMIAKALELDGTQRQTIFNDVPKSNKNSGYIQSAVESGIINGYSDGTFKPNSKVTRGHMAAFISRAFDLPNENKTFKDVKKGSTSYEAVSQLAAAGITTGYSDGTFKPNNNLTRGHISAFLARAIQYNLENPARDNTVTPPVNEQNMKVHFLDVDQGDSTLIQLATGENLLIDAGTDVAGEKVVAYLKSLNVKTLDYLIATHPDADHIGGMVDVLNAFDVETVINSGKIHTTATYRNFLTAVDKEGATYLEPDYGQIFEYDKSLDSYFQVLHTDPKADDNNDASLVVKAGYCTTDILLMADASSEIEHELMRNYDTLKSQILKAGHHGSYTSSSLEFLKAVNPKDIILSYGENNSYGYPHNVVLKNIKSVGAKAYSTIDGNIVATINCDGYKIETTEFDYETENTDVNSGTYVIPGAPISFKNCDEVRKHYPNGVKLGHPVYTIKLDKDSDGWGCEPLDDGVVEEIITPTPTPTPTKTYKNCTELRKDFPKGVQKGHWAYQSKMDGDKDGWACE